MASQGRITLVPVGLVSSDLLTWLIGRLTTALCPRQGEMIERGGIVGEGIPLPDSGYDPRRHQYLGKVPVPMKQKNTR